MGYKNKCQQLAYQREWMRARRTDFFKGKGCARCPSKKDLELHHKDPSKKVDHRIWSWREERRLVEIAKCEVLCKKCHQKLTFAPLIVHGSNVRYDKGCRCAKCRSAKAVKNKRQREARKLRKPEAGYDPTTS